MGGVYKNNPYKRKYTLKALCIINSNSYFVDKIKKTNTFMCVLLKLFIKQNAY